MTHSATANFKDLIPHKGDMCLIDEVISTSETDIFCTSSQHLNSHFPLAIPHGFSKLHLIEFGAQAVAIHSSLNMQADDQASFGMGYIVKVMKISFAAFNPDSSILHIQASYLMGDNKARLYSFEVNDDNEQLQCKGNVFVLHKGAEEHEDS